MLAQVKATIRKYQMFEPGDRVLAGVSGGPDSVALVHILNCLAEELGIRVYIAHLNHCLRGKESAEDAVFVQKLAKTLGLEAIIGSEDIARYASENKLSAQMAAREVRYLFFRKTGERLNCNKLATGHNADDQAETVLHNFIRGSGSGGLKGIPPVRDGWIVRPLIEIRRTLIEQYCAENCLQTRLDKSNLKKVYTRNRLRLELIPYLEKEYNAGLVETLVRTSEIFREEDEFLESVSETFWEKTCLEQKAHEITFDLTAFRELAPAIRKRIIRRAWWRYSGEGQNLGFVHLADAVELLAKGRSGGMLNLPGGVILKKGDHLFSIGKFIPGGEGSPVRPGGQEYSYKLVLPGITVIPETGEAILAEIQQEKPKFTAPEQDEIVIDLEKVVLPLTVRSRRPGDWFRPYGMTGSKKIKKYFIDRKIPWIERQRKPVLVTGDGQVIWLAGLRADCRWLAGPETNRALKLKLLRNIEKQN